MRTSPAEYYIRYRLVNDRDKSAEAISKELASEMVFPPSKPYLDDLRKEMTPPRSVFQPYNLQHLPSQQFLRRFGIWSMYHPSRGTQEATAVFGHLRARALLHTLIAGPHPDVAILEVMAARYPELPLSTAGLAEFKHYFWNIRLLTLEELIDYCSIFLKDKTMLTILRAPMSKDGMTYSLAKLGIVSEHVDIRTEYEGFIRDFGLERRGLQMYAPGLQHTTALKMAFEGFDSSVKELKAWGRETGEMVDEAARYIAKHHDLPNTTLEQLTEANRVPLPVSSLLRSDDVDIPDEPENEEEAL